MCATSKISKLVAPILFNPQVSETIHAYESCSEYLPQCVVLLKYLHLSSAIACAAVGVPYQVMGQPMMQVSMAVIG